MGFRFVGVLILLVFYGCYLGKMLRQRRRGVRTDQMGRGKTGRARGIELVMKASTYAVLAAEVVSIVLDVHALPTAVRFLGTAAGVVGTVVFVVSVVTMRDSWRAGVSTEEKTALVTEGIYQFSRNPAFLGFDLVYLGMVLMFFSYVLLALSLLAAVMFHLQIVYGEEPFLLGAFGEEYADYCRRVRRYWGRRR